MRQLPLRFLLANGFFFLIAACQLPAQTDSLKTAKPDSIPSQGLFDLLTQNQITDITITTAFQTFLDNKRHKEYLNGKFTFEPAENVDMTIPVRLRLRGRYRRMKCQFPPLKLKFKKSDLAAHDLNEFNELKLVTHCLDDETTSKELVGREYLTYRLFNILSENSFRVQMVDVTYRNTKGKPKKIKGRGILIEDADEVAYRMKGDIIDVMGLPDSVFNHQQEALVALFQYMIGNTDWSSSLKRNVELIKCDERGVLIVPYDFDFCGLVSAPYATPKTDLGQTSVRQRIFRGNADSVEDLHDAIHVFMEKKEELINEVNSFDILNRDSRNDIIEYLEEFFKAIESDHAVMENLLPDHAKE